MCLLLTFGLLCTPTSNGLTIELCSASLTLSIANQSTTSTPNALAQLSF
jgi:hypothetical protein